MLPSKPIKSPEREEKREREALIGTIFLPGEKGKTLVTGRLEKFIEEMQMGCAQILGIWLALSDWLRQFLIDLLLVFVVIHSKKITGCFSTSSL